MEAWSSTDDNAGVLIKANALREQAREVLISAARALELFKGGLGSGLLSIIMQARTAEAPVTRLLPQPPQPHSQAQPHPQPHAQPQSQPQADARARVAAQHAKAKQAQAEFRRLQHRSAQLQQHDRVKGPGRTRLLRLHTPVGSGQFHNGEGYRASTVTASKLAALKVADPTSFGPPGSRSSRRCRISWLRPRRSSRRNNGCSRPERCW